MMSMIVKNGKRMVTIIKNGLEVRMIDDGTTLYMSDLREGSEIYELPSSKFEEVLQAIDNNSF